MAHPRHAGFLREPLLHFLVLGAGLFLLYAWTGGPSAVDSERIVITQGRVQQLGNGFARMHQRAPDDAELKGLIDDAIREEIYYREAKALALDEDDTIVRRRLRQKLEFVSEDVASLPEPDDAQLEAYLLGHPHKFRRDRRYSLSHVFLDPLRPRIRDDAHQLLAELQAQDASGDGAGRGDQFLLGNRFDALPSDEVVRLFGAEFERRLRTQRVGEWHGPVDSAYGLHLVLVRDRSDDQTPPLASVRDAVRTEWLRSQRTRANERFYADLRKRYTVTIERPTKPAPDKGQVEGARS